MQTEYKYIYNILLFYLTSCKIINYSMICYAGESECYMICFVMAESNTIFYSKLIRDEGEWTHPINKNMYDV